MKSKQLLGAGIVVAMFAAGVFAQDANLIDEEHDAKTGTAADANNPLADMQAFKPQFTILDRGAGQPEMQFFVGFNMQFTEP